MLLAKKLMALSLDNIVPIGIQLVKQHWSESTMATLKEIWDNKGLTIEEVAAKADVSIQTVYRINRGQHVSLKSLRRVCQALDITIEQYKALEKGS